MNQALITEAGIISYDAYDKLIAATVHKLRQAGIGKGDRIAIVIRNCLEYLVLLRALFQMGGIAVPVNFRFPAQQKDSILRNINCRQGIASKDFFEKPDPGGIMWHEMDNFVLDVETEELAVDGSGMKIDKFPHNQDATIMFTSGSTSGAKAVLHTFSNHYFSALGSNQNIPFQQGDGWLLALPLYHVGGLSILFRAWVGGGAVIIPNSESSLTDSITKFQPTHISLVATQLYRLLKEKKSIPHLQKMKAILLGGSSIPHSLIEESAAYQLPICTSYGSTEMASQITTTKPGDSSEKLRTSGKLLKYHELKVAPDGEILVKGKTLCKGYVQDGKVIAAVDENGWFATGDLGRLDSEGYLTVSGRKDNLFISGGENILPEEIEQELCRIKGVKGAIVVPVKNEEFGERPAAFVEMEGQFPGQYFFRDYLADKIMRFKIPDYFFPLPESPQEMGIKHNRFNLRKLAERLIREIK